MDKFKEMLKKQKAFQDKYGFKVALHQWAAAMAAEGLELWGGCGGKWWKKKQNTPEENLEEVADIMHFILGYMLEANVSVDALYEAYCKKLKENYARQERGY